MIKDEEALKKPVLPAEVDLFELDLRAISDDGGIFLFCNEVNELGNQVVWRGRRFLPIPIKFEGAELRSDGPSNRPTLTVGNVDGYITGVIVKYKGLIGAKVTRYRVRANNLDAVNFENPASKANPNEYISSIYIVNRPEAYDKNQAIFELTLPTETDGAALPNRTVLATVCPFKYRGIGCGYDGHAVSDVDGNPLQPHELDKDQCDKSLRGCQRVFGVNTQLPFGGFVMADKVAK